MDERVWDTTEWITDLGWMDGWMGGRAFLPLPFPSFHLLTFSYLIVRRRSSTSLPAEADEQVLVWWSRNLRVPSVELSCMARKASATFPFYFPLR